MKMKKLTALALAGVLCLGMSTTAFAAQSPTDVEAAKEKDQGKVASTPINGYEGYGPYLNRWEIKKGETAKEASVRIENDINRWIYDLKEEKSETDSKDREEQVNKELAELEKLEGKNLQLVTSADIDYNGADKATRDFEKNPLTVRFNLNGRDVKPGDKISVMHEVKDTKGNAYWTVLTDVVVQEYKDADDPSKSMYYVDYDFTSFSNVILLKQLSDGTPDVIPNDPTDPTNPEDPADNLTPDANGNITADQLADLIVKKINDRVNATKVVRTAVSGKASPKTGE